MKRPKREQKARRHTRYNVFLTASLLKDDWADEQVLGEGDAFDLSTAGCQVVSRIRLDPGAHVGLRLALPGQEVTVRIEMAVVRWVEGDKCGLEFLGMTASERKQLDQFVAYLKSVAK